jgi:hypothetical protein
VPKCWGGQDRDKEAVDGVLHRAQLFFIGMALDFFKKIIFPEQDTYISRRAKAIK